jgi:hypothetical protein
MIFALLVLEFNFMRKQLLISTLLLTIFSCSESKEISSKKSVNSETVTGQLIEKEFTHKGGKLSEYKELHLRCSVQDYFIKICEGQITPEQLRPYLNKGIKVEIKIKEGHLDHCESTPEYSQSRIGTYIIINKIIK